MLSEDNMMEFGKVVSLDIASACKSKDEYCLNLYLTHCNTAHLSHSNISGTSIKLASNILEL